MKVKIKIANKSKRVGTTKYTDPFVVRENIKQKVKHSNKEAAKEVGALIAKRALEKNIKEVVFDRGGYIYHGVVKELAEDGVSVLNKWVLTEVWPTRVNGQELDRMSSDNSIEEIEFSVGTCDKL